MIGRPAYQWAVLPAAFVVLLAVGIGLRFHDLGEHFSHVDDLVTIAGPYLINQGEPLTVTVPGTGGRLSLAVDAYRIRSNPLLYAAYSTLTTYAPLQFLFYPLFLNGDFSYREFLWRGRMPSAIFASLALVAFIGLYSAWAGGLDAAGLLGLGILALSLMNITYAQQAMSYAVGVLGAALLMWLLVVYANRPTDARRLVWWAVVCAVLSWANYQVLMMALIAYAALAVTEYLRHRPQSLKAIVGRYALSASFFGVLVMPLFVLLRDKSRPGRLLSIDGFDQFFPRLPGGGLFDDVTYLLAYVARALYTVVVTNVTFALDSPAASACVALLFVLFAAGVWGLCVDRHPAALALGVFLGLLAVAWAVLNATGRFPLSPTRHVLVLSPIVALVIAIGVRRLGTRIRPVLGEAVAWTLLVAMVVFFGLGYGQFRTDRADRFDEERLGQLLDAYRLDTIVGYEWTWNPALMFRRSERRVTFLDLEPIMRKGAASKAQLPERGFLLVSQYGPIERYPREHAFLTSQGYAIRPLVSVESDVQPGVSKAVKWGANGLYVSVAGKAPAGSAR